MHTSRTADSLDAEARATTDRRAILMMETPQRAHWSRRLVPILHQSDDLLAVLKPAGIDVGARRGTDGQPGLVELLRDVWDLPVLEPINRLSRYESGILLLARKPEVLSTLRGALASGTIQQIYVAIVRGRFPKNRTVGGAIRLGGETTEKPAIKRRSTTRSSSTRNRPLKQTSRDVPAVTTLRLIHQGGTRAAVEITTRAENTHALRAKLRGGQMRLLGDLLHESISRTRSQADTVLHLTRVSLRRKGSDKPLIIKTPPPDGLVDAAESKRDWFRPLLAALVRRLPLLTGDSASAMRLLSGPSEDVPGLVVEQYGSAIVIELRQNDQTLREKLPAIARWYRKLFDAESVYLRDATSHRSTEKGDGSFESREPTLMLGRPLPLETVIHEGPLQFAVCVGEGPSVGLFLDQRDNRRYVYEQSRGLSVLNLFSYTCGFSVAAAAGGAQDTASVDLSATHLDWGRRNFELNELDTAEHQFIRDDALTFLKRAARNEKRFDLIICDAPTFAHGRKRKTSFLFTRDLPELVQAATQVLKRHGAMLISTNNRRCSLRRLSELVRQGVGPRRMRVMDSPALPLDFAVDPDHAKSLLVRFDG